ncbi:MAG: alpha-hydroxy acid oxidase [Rhodospirillaceae bacterium]|nr:alpha-hydroxy acid oxidase [Rhodospirillaceae bacterium]
MAGLSRILTIADMREAAQRRLPRVIFDFVDGAAEDELGKARNTAALDAVQVTPNYLVDIRERSQKTALFGQTWDRPVGIAPTGMSNLVWPDADLCLARAALAANVPCILSTAATTSIEDFGTAAEGRFWFQLYAQSDRETNLDLIRRAQDAGAQALVLTVDAPWPGKRERDLRNGFSVPFRMTPKMLLDGALHPRWALRFLVNPTPRLATIAAYVPENADARTLAAFMAARISQALTWDDLAWLRDAFDGPFLLKGLQSPADAVRAKALGVDGIIVSNHGGRQLDSAPAPVGVLPAIRAAVGPEMALILDSGIRRGSHIGRALALGADFTLVGRATLYGAAAAGRPGAARALDILRDELDRFQAQTGCPEIGDIGKLEAALPAAA